MTPDPNPYRPPTAQVELESQAGNERPLAGKGRRFFTLLIDYLGFYALGALIGIALALAGMAEAMQAMNRGEEFLFGLLVTIGYYLFFEGLWQRTPGKMLLGTRVVDEHGATPTFGAIVKRTLARCVPFEAFTFFGERGFHDKASRTRVVRTR